IVPHKPRSTLTNASPYHIQRARRRRASGSSLLRGCLNDGSLLSGFRSFSDGSLDGSAEGFNMSTSSHFSAKKPIGVVSPHASALRGIYIVARKCCENNLKMLIMTELTPGAAEELLERYHLPRPRLPPGDWPSRRGVPIVMFVCGGDHHCQSFTRSPRRRGRAASAAPRCRALWRS